MGTTVSTPAPLAPPFERMCSWNLKRAQQLLQDYKDKDLDFGLDATALSELLAGDTDWAKDIIAAFGSTNGIVNALAFICGAAIVCPGPALEKAGLIFDALDFDATEQISMDEMTIALLCAARGFCVVSGVGAVPSDEDLEHVTLQAYRELNKTSGQSIGKTEFTRWVRQFAAGTSASSSSSDASLDSALAQFGIAAPVKATAAFASSTELDPAAVSIAGVNDDNRSNNNNNNSVLSAEADGSGTSVAAASVGGDEQEQQQQQNEQYAGDEVLKWSVEPDDSAEDELAMQRSDDAGSSIPGDRSATPESESNIDVAPTVVVSEDAGATDDAQDYEQSFADEMPRDAEPVVLLEVAGSSAGHEGVYADPFEVNSTDEHGEEPAVAASGLEDSETARDRTDDEVKVSRTIEATDVDNSAPRHNEDAAAASESAADVPMASSSSDAVDDDDASTQEVFGGAATKDSEIEATRIAEPPRPASPVDLNDFDAFNYTDAAFDASSGLPPPEDPADFADANDDEEDTDAADSAGRKSSSIEAAARE